jgi:ribulose 1,5-bisphosphate synthetase/thiazole synthase
MEFFVVCHVDPLHIQVKLVVDAGLLETRWQKFQVSATWIHVEKVPT